MILHKFLPELFLPLGLSLGLLVLGAVRRRRWPAITAVVLLGLASNPFVSGRVMRLAEEHAVRRAPASLPSADAVVVLSAGRIRPPGEPVSEWVDADRFFGGLELWRAGKAPQLVFTRPPTRSLADDQTEGDVLAALARDLSVPAEAILLTGEVLNTADEARETAAVLPRGSAVLLVTSAFHMARARQLFESAGFRVHAFPVDFRVGPRAGWSVMDVVPSVSALQNTHLALREFYGRAYYRVFG